MMIVRKFNPRRKHVGLHKCIWIPKETIQFPDSLMTENQFAEFIQSKFGQGRYYISGDSKKGKHRGFYTIFLGVIKNGKAKGRGKWKYYLSKNRERIEKNKEKALNQD